jgi:hypothetical protein
MDRLIHRLIADGIRQQHGIAKASDVQAARLTIVPDKAARGLCSTPKCALASQLADIEPVEFLYERRRVRAHGKLPEREHEQLASPLGLPDATYSAPVEPNHQRTRRS